MAQMAIAHFTDRENLNWKGHMPGPGKPQFTVPIQGVLAETMRGGDIPQGGNQKREAEKGEKWCGRRREESSPWKYIPKAKVLSMVPPAPHFLVSDLLPLMPGDLDGEK